MITNNLQLVLILSFKIATQIILKKTLLLKMSKMLKKQNLMKTKWFNMKHLKARVKMNLVWEHLNQQLIHLQIRKRIQMQISQGFKNTKELRDKEERKENIWKRWNKRLNCIVKRETTSEKSIVSNHMESSIMMSIKMIC